MSMLSRSASNKKGKRIEEEDGFNKLPDETIVEILSLLNLHEAINSSLLSGRWKHLWTYITTSLCLDSGKKYGNKYFRNKKFNEDNYKERFVNWVNHVLEVHQGSFLDQFKVIFSLDQRNSSAVNSWLEFAVNKRVEILDLNFSDFHGRYQKQPIALVESDKLKFTSDNRLKILRLVSVDVCERVVNHILNNCPLLEELCIVNARTMSNLEICVTKSHKLRHLVLFRCESLLNLEICASNLVSFSYTGPKKKVPFRDTPLLSELFVSHEYCEFFVQQAPRHSSYFSWLIKLTIVPPMRLSKKGRYYKNFPKLNNLKMLELRVCITRGKSLIWLTCFIDAAPVLSKFVMKLQFALSWPKGVLELDLTRKISTNKYSHKWLKEIEFIGFVGHAPDFELAAHLLEISSVLEKITIDIRPTPVMFILDELCDTFVKRRRPSDGSGNLLKETREATHELRSRVPNGVQLQLLPDDAFLP